MRNKTKILTASSLFLSIVVLHILGLLFDDTLAFFTKPFIMISLVVVYLTSVKKANFWLVSALFFSFWGDVFLLFKEEFFLFGLVSFLIAHILYIKILLGCLEKTSLIKVVLAAMPFVLFFTSIVFFIIDGLGEMLLPILIYGLVICTFGTLTLLKYRQAKNTENLWMFLGAILFVFSDSLIAINRFYEPKEMYGISIMLTYIVAQYLICKAMIVKSFYQE
ncbi:lysoplasmalogenase [Polaribacter sp.]|uniref:lysoplasmalogenase n=1 Tax=Polaribacter sp. TaxID=1920175 RepID=UPI003EF0D398